MITLRTDRFALVAWSDADADVDALYDMYSRWEVQRFIGAAPRVMQSRAEAVALVARWSALGDDTCGVWAIREDGAALGSVLLKPIPWSAGAVADGTPQDIEIGWHLHPDAWGRGVASEAAAAVLRHARGRGIRRVVAVTNPENLASQRVAERIGMSRLGRTERYYDVVTELFAIDLT